MKYNNIFSKIPVKVFNRAGHNMSHHNSFTAKCGTLTPALVELVFPNELHTVNVSAQVQLPPFVTDVYGEIDAVWELFFVPCRLLYGGWQEFITFQTENSLYPVGTPSQSQPKYLPQYSATYSPSSSSDVELFNRRFGAGSLADYLGDKREFRIDVDNNITITNLLPYLAYHKIWDDWYRQSNIQRSCFIRPIDSGTNPGTLPYQSFGGDSPRSVGVQLADLTEVFSLRQRSWAKDYFTNSTPLPQSGESFGLKISPSDDGSIEFNMSQLYALNAAEQFAIRHNLAGNRYADNLYSNFGCYPSDAVVDRALYLGRKIVPVYTKSVYQQSESSDNTTQNPFNSVGSKYGSPMGVGSGNLCKNFKSSEHGFLFCMFSLVPRPYYSSGQRRYLRYSKQSDFPFPILQGMGDQPIYVSELVDSFVGLDGDETFGYSQYASEVKFHTDEVHGLLRDGQSLESFVLQRSFSTVPELGTSFLEIPQNFLDQVTAISGQVSQYGCWVHQHIGYKKASPFQPYTIATMSDPDNTHTIMIDKQGKRL